MLAESDGAELAITLTVAGTLPSSYATVQAEINILVVVEVDRSGKADYWISVQNRENGDWEGELDDYVVTHTYAGTAFPGVASVIGNKVMMRVPLTALGSPDLMRLQARTQWVDHETGDVIAQDFTPDGSALEPKATWLTLALS